MVNEDTHQGKDILMDSFNMAHPILYSLAEYCLSNIHHRAGRSYSAEVLHRRAGKVSCKGAINYAASCKNPA
jgi:hypothetical protein